MVIRESDCIKINETDRATIIEGILTGTLTAYARIDHQPEGNRVRVKPKDIGPSYGIWHDRHDRLNPYLDYDIVRILKMEHIAANRDFPQLVKESFWIQYELLETREIFDDYIFYEDIRLLKADPEPLKKAAQILAAPRTVERDKYVVHIMEKIDKGVRDISSNRQTTDDFKPNIEKVVGSNRALFTFTETPELLAAVIDYERGVALPAKRLLNVRSWLYREASHVVKGG